ncbi:MAG: hypothetical protein Q7K44_04270 [Candidatus Liptonbacteria bacterium]|nr:hypothetical protein [Candidatus Liptonbacteria bacterium]
MGTPNNVTAVNGSSYRCPMCSNKTNSPYGRITDKIGACSKQCSTGWDILSFDDKQIRIGRINGVKPDMAAQQAA